MGLTQYLLTIFRNHCTTLYTSENVYAHLASMSTILWKPDITNSRSVKVHEINKYKHIAYDFLLKIYQSLWRKRTLFIPY